MRPSATAAAFLPSFRGQVLDLAGCDPADHDGSADYVSGALLAFRASGALVEDLSGFHRGFQAVSLRFSGRLIRRHSSNFAIRRNHHGQKRKTLFRRTIDGESNFPHFEAPLLSLPKFLE
jgi:hypothetical protein